MKKTNIMTSFGRYSDAELALKARLIINSMRGNIFFANPSPPLVEIEAATNEFEITVVNAKGLGKVNKLIRRNKRALLVDFLMKLSLYVKVMANDNAEAFASSGFTLSKVPEPVGILVKPQDFKVVPGHIGTINLKLKIIYGAKAYLYEYRKEGTEEWAIVVDTKSKILLTGLASGTKYQFRVAGMGTVPQRIYSDVLSSYIL